MSMKCLFKLPVFDLGSVVFLQVSGSNSCQKEEDHPADHGAGRGASVRHSSHGSAGGERGRHREAVGRLPEGPKTWLLLRCLTGDEPHVLMVFGLNLKDRNKK